MLTSLAVYHFKGSRLEEFVAPAGYYHFATCMRSIVIGMEHPGDSLKLRDYTKFSGRDAYSFLLEVICGLHSPLFGETEVLGQFREFVKNHSSQFHGMHMDILGSLLTDAKRIRSEHLQNIGSHSYGSLIRRRLPSTEISVHILGAGHLVEEILPWLKKEPYRMQLFTRNIDKHDHLLTEYPQLQLRALANFASETADAVIIAAPVRANELQAWLDLKNPAYVFDLRGTSKLDPVHSRKYFPLHKLFADIESNQKKVAEIKKSALSKALQLAEQKYLQEKPRPFGWDDLWS